MLRNKLHVVWCCVLYNTANYRTIEYICPSLQQADVTLLVLILYEDRRPSQLAQSSTRPFILSVHLSDERSQCRVYLDNLPALLFSLAPRDVIQPSCCDWNAIARPLSNNSTARLSTIRRMSTDALCGLSLSLSLTLSLVSCT